MRCPECKMHYEPDYPENVKEHKIYHDKIVNGIYARRIKSDKIAWENSDYRITVVNYYSPSTQKKRADKAGRAAHEDTPFTASIFFNSRISIN